jgi:hypothetical protein
VIKFSELLKSSPVEFSEFTVGSFGKTNFLNPISGFTLEKLSPFAFLRTNAFIAGY